MTDEAPETASEPGDAPELLRIVNGFRAPADAFMSMAKIHPGEAHTWGIYASRHSGRASRNAHRLRIMQMVALATRSEDAWGSHEAADVAKGTPKPQTGFLASLSGTSTDAQDDGTPKRAARTQPQEDE